MSEALFRISTGGSLTEKAEQLVDGMTLDDPADVVLATMIVELARSIDAAGGRGRASAAAMAARELREAIKDLRERNTPIEGSPEDEFAHFRDFMLSAVKSSAS